ncbi:unnamed protein product [Polarella glacialis]|uniref:Uncharacterized protein n=1 Tax=Polarella glacialis TaxID=89957 RepID=A0A813FYI4_POLGL|nr:unnamed protein product [Polarella glacialis]
MEPGMPEADIGSYEVRHLRASVLCTTAKANTDPSGLVLTSGFESRCDSLESRLREQASRADAFCLMEDFSSHLSEFRTVGHIQTDPAIKGPRTGIVAMPELDFAVQVPNMPGMLMESPCRGRRKQKVRFNLKPEIHTISGNDPIVRQVSEPFDPPALLVLSVVEKETELRSLLSTVELMLRARRLMKLARNTFHTTRPSENTVSVY